MEQTSQETIHELVDHLFRHKAGQLIAILTSVFGIEHLDLAEDVVQETLIKAMRRWPYTGVPTNPGGWLMEVAKNRAVDILRRKGRWKEKVAHIGVWESTSLEREGAEWDDDVLTMMFLCCDPSLTREGQLALSLKSVGGFSVAEIARAFLASETTVAQRLVRAKRRLREGGAVFTMPDQAALPSRVEAVLGVVYLMFNEGYAAHQGEDLVRRDLCIEAIRLCGLLARHAAGNQPQVFALLALMLFQASRLEARIDAEGELIQLAEQDRGKWDQGMIQQGFAAMERATRGETLSDYHLQAGIAACHAAAGSFEETDWAAILFYYDVLMERGASPVVALNRAVAVAMHQGVEAGLAVLDGIAHQGMLDDYYLLEATRGEYYQRMGRYAEAAACYQGALGQTQNEAERRFLIKKIGVCEGRLADQ